MDAALVFISVDLDVIIIFLISVDDGVPPFPLCVSGFRVGNKAEEERD